ncbi:hypothetical protein LguiA_017825 [Lonicera macranthoides]
MLNATFSYILLLVAVILLIKADASPSSVNLTRVYSAVAKGAVCLDGSPPAYHFDKGKGKGINNWLGGGWCNSVEKCSNRSKDPTGLGSSHKMVPRGFYGILSNSKKDNPNFYNWNRVMVRYCDGLSFTGDADKVHQGSEIYFRGARVFDAIMEDLLERGMEDASNALLSGCSAGGLASILHCDKFRALLATEARVKCLSDGGYFLHAKDFYGGYHFEYNTFDKVVGVHGSEKNLPQTCLRSEFLNTILTRLGNPSSRGWFINSCYDHCQSVSGPRWLGPNVTLDDKTISEAVGDWFYDKRVVHLVDHKYNLPRLCVHDK